MHIKPARSRVFFVFHYYQSTTLPIWDPGVLTIIIIFSPYWWLSCNKLFPLTQRERHVAEQSNRDQAIVAQLIICELAIVAQLIICELVTFDHNVYSPLNSLRTCNQVRRFIHMQRGKYLSDMRANLCPPLSAASVHIWSVRCKYSTCSACAHLVTPSVRHDIGYRMKRRRSLSRFVALRVQYRVTKPRVQSMISSQLFLYAYSLSPRFNRRFRSHSCFLANLPPLEACSGYSLINSLWETWSLRSLPGVRDSLSILLLPELHLNFAAATQTPPCICPAWTELGWSWGYSRASSSFRCSRSCGRQQLCRKQTEQIGIPSQSRWRRVCG